MSSRRHAALAVLVAAAAALASPAHGQTNAVRIDDEEALVPEREAALWVVTTMTPSVPLALTQPSSGPATVDFVSSNQPGKGTVAFTEGQQHAEVDLTFAPAAPDEFAKGWGARWAYFALTATTGGLTHGFPTVMYMLQVGPLSGRESGLEECYLFLWSQLLCLLDVGPCFPWVAERPEGGVAGGGNPLEPYHRYRDEILNGTAAGQFYRDLYAQHTADAFAASLAAPSHVAAFHRAWQAWTPSVQALVDGNGASVPVTGTMQATLLALLDILEANGSPALAQAISTERARLQLDSIAGLTMAEFQTQVETLGGTNALEPVTWGGVKALYR